MITRWIEDLKNTPSRLGERREKLSARRRELTTKARTQLRTAAGDGQERLWTLGTSALERADSALERTSDVPVVGMISKGAHKLVSGRLDALTALPVNGYDGLNARQAIAAIRDIDGRIALANVRRHEQQNKNRKTVLRAIEARIATA